MPKREIDQYDLEAEAEAAAISRGHKIGAFTRLVKGRSCAKNHNGKEARGVAGSGNGNYRMERLHRTKRAVG